MFGRLGTLLALLFCLWALLVQPTSSSPMLAAQVIGTETSTDSLELAAVLQALPPDCGGMATPLNYNQPVCCLNGYVYLNGEPIANATVTISANGESITAQIREDDPDSDAPYFIASLSNPPLNVRAGQEVTITAQVGEETATRTFTAETGGQQQDVVLSTIQVGWQRENVSKRLDHVMAYDGEGVIIFGGLDDNGRLNDTWRWDGNTWTIETPADSPPSRNKHTMAYDSVRDRIVLFGGYQDSDNRLNDTWEWDGETWSKVTPLDSPSARTSHAMVYDVNNQQIILFGGYDGENYLNDTWVWDGSNWTEKSQPNPPSGRANHAMAYDAERGNIIFFGGYNGNTHLGDTWVWDGNAWNQETPTTSPPPRYQHTMEYDAANGEVVLFSGFNGTYLNDTWLWDGTTWIERQPQNSPQARREHAMAYDATGERIVLFGGDAGGRLGDTWEWDGTNWFLRTQGGEDSPSVRKGAALSYESAGQSLLFGGTDDSTWDNSTYRWTGSSWNQLNPTTSPTGREGHRLARNADGSLLLLFGGLNSGTYLNDTWLWNGSNWQEQSPALIPSVRAGYGLTYDSQRGVWLLFGGENGNELGDTWEYNGTSWVQYEPANSPSPRSGSTLIYDSLRERTVLIGGESGDQFLNDVWEWDGTDWENVTPNNANDNPPPRAYHEAAYLSTPEVVVIAGGLGNSGALTDTWQWDGTQWEQHLTFLPARYNFGMTYNSQNDRLVAFGGQNTITLVNGTYLYDVGSSNVPPIATINRIEPRDAKRGLHTITFQGSGTDADATDIIKNHSWRLNGEIITNTQLTFNLPASQFPVGEHTISFQVQDNENTWSEEVLQHIEIDDNDGGSGGNGTWTLLIYAVGDNNLDLEMGDYQNTNGMLYRLKNAGEQENVEVGILYDGAYDPEDEANTRLYILQSDGTWTEDDWIEDEAQMDKMETLHDFIQWGYQKFDSDYYALALLDHASGVLGIGQDETSDKNGNAFLSPLELREALRDGTNNGSPKLDVLHYDGCSFGLLENTAIARGLAEYVIASPNTGWGVFAYEYYRQLAGGASNPREYAISVAEEYANKVAFESLPYTISVFDMEQFEEVNAAVSALGDSLLTYVQNNPDGRTELRNIRNASQKYDSIGENIFEIDNQDNYVDIYNFAFNLQNVVGDSNIIEAAIAVTTAIQGPAPFIIYESHQSGAFNYYDEELLQYVSHSMILEDAAGLGIFYPYVKDSNSESYQKYVRNEIFDTTRDSDWTRFIADGLPSLPPGQSSPPEQLISPLIPQNAQVQHRLFLPSIQR